MNWLGANWQQVIDLALAHLLLSVPPIFISIIIAVPIGRLAFLRPRIGGPVLATATLLYAVPALPLLILVPAILGIPLRSSATLIIALSAYGIALLVRTAADAFSSVEPRIRDAAIAIGNSPRSVFWRIDLPLAVPVLLSGVRVVTVSTISLVTIGALIGIPSLGSLLTDGFQRGIAGEVVTGLLATVLLALFLDGIILGIGRLLTPWISAERRTTALREASA